MAKKLTEEENFIRNLGFSLKEMVETKGWQNGLKPHLEGLANHSWVDPQEAKDKEDFFYKYSVSWAKAKSAAELLKWINNMISQAKRIEAKAKGETADKFEKQFE